MVRLPSIVRFIVIALFAWIPGVAAGEEPRRLSPASGWLLDYADDSYRLARSFGEGDQSIILAMDRFQPGDYFQVSLIGHPLRRARSGGRATLRFGPAEAEESSGFYDVRTGDVPTMIISRSLRIAPLTESERELQREARKEGRPFDAAPIDPARERAAEYLYLDAPGLSPVVLETGSLGESFRAFRQCTDELMNHWGIDVDRHRSLTRKAIPTQPLASWFADSDYPGRALSRGQQALIHFRLTVDTEGRVSDCRIQRSTAAGEAFREALCSAMRRRARFEPALDAQGVPIRSYHVSSVIFRIPG